MNNSFVAQNFGCFAEVIAYIALSTNPIQVTRQAFFEVHLRNITRGANSFGPADKVPHLAWAKLPVNLRRDFDPERVRDSLPNFAHTNGFAAADINRLAVEYIRLGCEQVS